MKDDIYRPHAPSNDEKDNETSLINKDEEFEHGKHPNSIKALKKHQYPKGFSGNPMGRKPQFENLKKELKKLGDEETYNYHKESQGTRKEQVLKRIWKDAMYGDMRKIQLLAWLGCLD